MKELNHLGRRSNNLDWVEGLKAFAILAILLNHLVESTGSYPWFSNPSYNWSEISIGTRSILPNADNFFFVIVKFLGWLGDMGPGVFILLSGLTLSLSQCRKASSIKMFYKKRLLRIYPLYITIHIIILFAYVISSGYEVLLDKKLVFSLLGLRFSDGLFFYMNPSWWFIWLILQMYLVFPWLFKLMQKSSLRFLLITLGLTILSRLAGLLHVTYNDSLYYWMTGLFGGTRLFEFAFGMFLGKLIYEKSSWLLVSLTNIQKLAMASLLIYILGFTCSLFYWITLFSNILITIGLSGLFYVLYNFFKSSKRLKQIILIIGSASFPVFLLHQPFIKYFSHKYDLNKSLILSIIIITLLFPLGLKLNALTERITAKYFTKNK